MKLFIRICLSLCAAALFATTANAQYWNPWNGWWGTGYYGSPAYAAPVYSSYYGSRSSTSFYGSANYGSSSWGCCGTASPAYAVSYGSSGNGCCATSCCDACGTGCASGSCAGVTPAGSLKPAQDPNFQKKATDYDDEIRSRTFNPDSTSPGTDDLIDPVDSSVRKDLFGRPKEGTGGGTGSGSGAGTFEEDKTDPALDRTLQKPPMTDPQDGKTLDPVETEPGNPVDAKTFFEDSSKPADSASRGRDAIIARTGSLSEVIAPKRLASRSLPVSQRSASASRLAKKLDNTKSDSPRPLRWISAPLADGHVQL